MAVEKHQKRYALDSLFFKRLKACFGILFPAIISNSSLLLMTLLGVSIGQQLVIFNVGLLPSNFMEVLGDKDKSALKGLLIKALTLIITISIFNSASKAISGFIHLHWRNVMTTYLQKRYFTDSFHYFITTNAFGNIDNPDQRITQDVDRFCLTLSNITGKIIISPLIIIYYSYKCFKVTNYVGPLIIYAYFFIGTFFNRLIMSFIVNLIYIQEKKEGDLRYKHAKIRTLSESIALADADHHELFKVSCCLKDLLILQRKIVKSEIFLNFSTNFFDYLGSMISYIIISVPIFSGKYDSLTSVELSAAISKNAFVSMYLINCFSTLVDLSSQFTDMSGYAHRIGELIETFSNKKARNNKLRTLNSKEDNALLFEISNLTYGVPNLNKTILSDLNVKIYQNQNLLVIGNTGIGKSSLLRIIKSLWKPITGSCKFNTSLVSSKNQIMVLPQTPILTNGSLLEQIIFPNLKRDIENYQQIITEVLKSLQDVGLDHLVGRLSGIDIDPQQDLSQSLSPGEIQRLVFARLFFHKPKLVFLDEATSSIGTSEEECFYTYCSQLGITVVSIGHRDSLKRYHHNYLKINSNGSWEYGEI